MLRSAHINDVALIHELWDEYASSFAAGDIERWNSLWIRGGIELSAAGLLLSGTEQIRAASRPAMDLFDSEMTFSPEDVQILGHNAYSYGSYKQVMIPKEGGESIISFGMYLAIFEKQAGGSWKIAVACFNHGQRPASFRYKCGQRGGHRFVAEAGFPANSAPATADESHY